MPHSALRGEQPSGFQDLLGYRLADWQPGSATLELDVEPCHLNRGGSIHGGVLSTLIDTACGFAATYCAQEGHARRVVTLSLTVNYTGIARHGRIRAIARTKGGGAKIVFCEADVLDEDGRVLAFGNGSFRYRSGSERPEGVPL